jgi:threonyl-tRNA synthetase
MIHRAPLGSMERFMGILIEHFAGAFPLWLAPEQVRVLPISDKVAHYGQHVLARLLEQGFRATVDLRAEKIGAKIRDAQLEKIPAMLVVGAKEAESEAVSYRDRTDGDQGAMPLLRAIDRLLAERSSRQSRQTAPPAPAVAVEDAAEDHTY